MTKTFYATYVINTSLYRPLYITSNFPKFCWFLFQCNEITEKNIKEWVWNLRKVKVNKQKCFGKSWCFVHWKPTVCKCSNFKKKRDVLDWIFVGHLRTRLFFLLNFIKDATFSKMSGIRGCPQVSNYLFSCMSNRIENVHLLKDTLN